MSPRGWTSTPASRISVASTGGSAARTSPIDLVGGFGGSGRSGCGLAAALGVDTGCATCALSTVAVVVGSAPACSGGLAGVAATGCCSAAVTSSKPTFPNANIFFFGGGFEMAIHLNRQFDFIPNHEQHGAYRLLAVASV